MIGIIDYRAGNLKSVERALNKLAVPCRITADREVLLEAERIIFPGVGAAGKALEDLRHLGLDRVLIQAYEQGKPILGICLGAQIVLEKSQENNTRCLGLVPGEVKRFPTPLLSRDHDPLKIPHMGWNNVRILKPHPVLAGIREEDEFYFVHSYYTEPASETWGIGQTEHGIEFTSILGSKNLIATQFHPEKSGVPGLRILKNFSTWKGTHAQ